MLDDFDNGNIPYSSSRSSALSLFLKGEHEERLKAVRLDAKTVVFESFVQFEYFFYLARWGDAPHPDVQKVNEAIFIYSNGCDCGKIGLGCFAISQG